MDDVSLQDWMSLFLCEILQSQRDVISQARPWEISGEGPALGCVARRTSGTCLILRLHVSLYEMNASL